LADFPRRTEPRLIARRQAMADDGAPAPRLGSRIAARFAGQGLTEDLPELHGQAPRPAELEP